MTSVVTTGMVFVLGVVAPVLVNEPGFSTRWIGALSSIYFAATVVASGLVGRLVDRSLPRSAALAHLLVAGGLVGLATGVPVVVAGAVAVGGIANAFLNPVTNRMVLLGSESRRRVLIGVKQAGTPLGGAAVGAILPALVVRLGWQAATAVVAGAVVLLGLSWSRSASRRPTRAEAATADEPSRDRLGDLPSVMRFALALGMVNGIVVTFLPLYATEELGASLSTAGVLVVTASVASIAGRVGWTFLPASYVGGALVSLCGLGAIGSMGIAVAGPGGGLVHVAVASVGVSAMGWHGLFMRWLIGVVPASHLGSISARVMRPYYLGLVVSPAFGGLLGDAVGLRSLWWVQAGLCGLALMSVRALRTSASAGSG